MCSIILNCKNNLTASGTALFLKENTKIWIYQAKTPLDKVKIIVTIATSTYKNSYINSFQEK